MSPDGTPNRWRFKKEPGYPLLNYQAFQRDTGKVGFEVNNSQFTDVNGIMLPQRINIKNYYYPSCNEKQVVYETTITVREFRLNDPNNVPSAYDIAWPPTSVVLDQRTEDVRRSPQ